MTTECARTEVLVSIDDVCLSFGDNVVLDHVTASIRDIIVPGRQQGQVVGILGPSGRGKTQLFRILAGLNQPTSGGVRTSRQTNLGEYGLAPVHAGSVGVVDQHYTLFNHRTVGDNLLLASPRGKKDSDRAKELLAKFQLESRWGAYPGELSGGQRQRVAICQQMMCTRDVLLMDEPFSGLDPIMKEEACKLITDTASVNERMTVIVITHDIASSVKISDTLWLLGRGHEGPGSRIQKEIDLIERDLAWSVDITSKPGYLSVMREVGAAFRTL